MGCGSTLDDSLLERLGRDGSNVPQTGVCATRIPCGCPCFTGTWCGNWTCKSHVPFPIADRIQHVKFRIQDDALSSSGPWSPSCWACLPPLCWLLSHDEGHRRRSVGLYLLFPVRCGHPQAQEPPMRGPNPGTENYRGDGAGPISPHGLESPYDGSGPPVYALAPVNAHLLLNGIGLSPSLRYTCCINWRIRFRL